MRERTVHQVVVPPGTDQDLIDQIEAKIKPDQKPMSRWLRLRLAIGYLTHSRFHHTWVTWNSFDSGSGRILEMGETCMFCTKGRVR